MHDLLIPERDGFLSLHASPDLPKAERTRYMSSAASAGAGVSQATGNQSPAWVEHRQPVPETMPADPANHGFYPHEQVVNPLPRGGYGSWAGALPVTSNGLHTSGQHSWMPVERIFLNTNPTARDWAPDNDFLEVVSPNYATGKRIPYGVLGIALNATGHGRDDKIVMPESLRVSDYGSSRTDEYSSYLHDVHPSNFLDPKMKARESTYVRVRRWLGMCKKATVQKPPSQAPGNPTPPAEGEVIPPAGDPVTGPDIEKFPPAIALQFGDERTNFWDKYVADPSNPNAVPKIPGMMGFATFGTMVVSGAQTSPFIGGGGQGPFLWEAQVDLHLSAMASGPLTFASSKHEFHGFPKKAPPQGLNYTGTYIPAKQDQTLRAGANSTEAYFTDGAENTSSSLPPWLAGKPINPNYDGPYSFNRYTRPKVLNAPFMVDVQTPFDFDLDHGWRCAPGTSLTNGGKWHPLSFSYMAETPPADPVPDPGEDPGFNWESPPPPDYPPDFPWEKVDEGKKDKRLTYPGKTQGGGHYGQGRANILRGADKDVVTPVYLSVRNDRHSWVNNGNIDDGELGYTPLDQLAMPVTHGEHSLYVFDQAQIDARGSNARPKYTKRPKFHVMDHQGGDDKFITIMNYEAGTGDGIKAFAPAELREEHLYGSDGAGVIPVEDYPAQISALTVLMVNRADVVTRVAFGNPLLTSVMPGNGFVFTHDVGNGRLAVTGTDASGATDATKRLQIGAYHVPMTDGSNGQALVTNGSGVVSWQDVGSGDVYRNTGSSTDSTPVQIELVANGALDVGQACVYTAIGTVTARVRSGGGDPADLEAGDPRSFTVRANIHVAGDGVVTVVNFSATDPGGQAGGDDAKWSGATATLQKATASNALVAECTGVTGAGGTNTFDWLAKVVLDGPLQDLGA